MGKYNIKKYVRDDGIQGTPEDYSTIEMLNNKHNIMIDANTKSFALVRRSDNGKIICYRLNTSPFMKESKYEFKTYIDNDWSKETYYANHDIPNVGEEIFDVNDSVIGTITEAGNQKIILNNGSVLYRFFGGDISSKVKFTIIPPSTAESMIISIGDNTEEFDLTEYNGYEYEDWCSVAKKEYEVDKGTEITYTFSMPDDTSRYGDDYGCVNPTETIIVNEDTIKDFWKDKTTITLNVTIPPLSNTDISKLILTVGDYSVVSDLQPSSSETVNQTLTYEVPPYSYLGLNMFGGGSLEYNPTARITNSSIYPEDNYLEISDMGGMILDYNNIVEIKEPDASVNVEIEWHAASAPISMYVDGNLFYEYDQLYSTTTTHTHSIPVGSTVTFHTSSEKYTNGCSSTSLTSGNATETTSDLDYVINDKAYIINGNCNLYVWSSIEPM